MSAKPIKIKAPAVGRYSITAFSLTAKKAPRLRVIGKVPSNIVVALGVTKDKNHAGHYVAFAVLLDQRSPRKVQAVAERQATFIVVDPGGAEVGRNAVAPSLTASFSLRSRLVGWAVNCGGAV